MKYTNKSFSPNSILSKYIDRFYLFEKSCSNYFELPTVLPGTGLELVFHLSKPLSIDRITLPKAHTVCPRKAFNFDKEKIVSFISVRFKSGAFRHFSPVPFSELNDKYYSIESIWGQHGEFLLKKLQNCKTEEDMIQTIQFYLEFFFNEYHDKRNDKWDGIIDELYYNFNDNTISKIAEKSNLSLRQFEREFKNQFGLTAKKFQKITRFQEVTKSLLLNKNSNYLTTILDKGYFDQSHFIKEFKLLTKKTPLEYFTDKNFDTHFYHKSMKKNSIS